MKKAFFQSKMWEEQNCFLRRKAIEKDRLSKAQRRIIERRDGEKCGEEERGSGSGATTGREREGEGKGGGGRVEEEAKERFEPGRAGKGTYDVLVRWQAQPEEGYST